MDSSAIISSKLAEPGDSVPKLSGIAALEAYDVCDLFLGLSSGIGDTYDAVE